MGQAIVRDLIGACLTAPGEGGLHVFRVRGDGVGQLLARIFQPVRSASRSALRYGHLVNGDDPVDEVMVHAADLQGTTVEITTHGGVAVRDAVLELLSRHGARLVGADDPAISESQDAIAREANAALGRARTMKELLFYLRALQGAFSDEVALLRGTLERGAPPEPVRRAIVARLDALIGRASFGCAFESPPTVLIAGPPNAGKSTLANRLLGSDRCIVTPEAGTTRDLVSERLALGGYPFRLLDSAGVRSTTDPIEGLGVARTLERSRDSDLLLLVLDGSVPLPADPRIRELLGARKTIVVLNKSDLGGGRDRLEQARAQGRPVLPVSALDGEGMAQLREAIFYRSPFRGPATHDLPCPFTSRQVRCLMAARESVGADLRAAAAALAELLEDSG